MPSHGLYLEFTKTDAPETVAQVIIIGDTQLHGKIVPYSAWSRQIRPENPQSRWTPEYTAVAADDQFPRLNADKDFVRSASTAEALTRAKTVYEKAGAGLDGMLVWGWVPREVPLVFEVSELDAVDLDANVSPKDLISRVNKLRDKNGFPPLPKKKGV